MFHDVEPCPGFEFDIATLLHLAARTMLPEKDMLRPLEHGLDRSTRKANYGSNGIVVVAPRECPQSAACGSRAYKRDVVPFFHGQSIVHEV